MEITIRSNLTLAQVPEILKKQFIDENTFDNPEYRMRKALGKWLKGTPEKIRLYSFNDDTQEMNLPRGYLPAVIAISRRNDIVFHIQDNTLEPWANFGLEVNGALEAYQQEALDNLLHYPCGTLVGPPGCGKTNILLSAIPELKTRALIIVHTKELLAQTVQRCKDWLGVTPGVIGGGKWQPEDITVGMIQTLARRDLPGMDITGYFGAILTDEGHHVAAKTWSSVLEQFPARYKYAFTATPQRKDGYSFLIWRFTGGKTAEIKQEEVIEAGRIVWPKFMFRGTKFKYTLQNKGDWTFMLNQLAFDQDRNDEIIAEIMESIPYCESALVLTDRVGHAELLARRLEGFDPVLLHGQLNKKERTEGMERVRSGTKLTIATIGLVGEGVDVPGWDLLYLVTPIAGGSRTVQAIGRVARAKEGKAAASVVDFVDVCVDGYREKEDGTKEYYYPLREAATKRRRLYRLKKTQAMLF